MEWQYLIGAFIYAWSVYWIFVAEDSPPKLPPGEYGFRKRNQPRDED